MFEFINLWYKIDGSYYLDAPGKFLQMIFCLERLTEGGNKNEKKTYTEQHGLPFLTESCLRRDGEMDAKFGKKDGYYAPMSLR